MMDIHDGRQIVVHASTIGAILEKSHPRVEAEGATMIAAKDVVEIADTITLVVAQILQSWLNAGSERDNTIEELGPAIEDHVRSWAA
jgi:hypothetical protein